MAEVPQKSLERYDVLDRIAVGGQPNGVSFSPLTGATYSESIR